jgi:hypothetical protein
MTDLELCPWCAKAPAVSPEIGKFSASLACQNEGCPVQPAIYGHDYGELIARWNARAEVSA